MAAFISSDPYLAITIPALDAPVLINWWMRSFRAVLKNSPVMEVERVLISRYPGTIRVAKESSG